MKYKVLTKPGLSWTARSTLNYPPTCLRCAVSIVVSLTNPLCVRTRAETSSGRRRGVRSGSNQRCCGQVDQDHPKVIGRRLV